jgi:CP family cyanate transporter-like MFS transporter
VVGGAIAVGNVLVPVIVKRDFPQRISFATGVYSACVTMGAGASAALAVPFASIWGWQGSLAFWAIPAVVVAVLWLPRAKRAPAKHETPVVLGESPVALWRRPTAWLVTAFMGLQSTAFYVMVTWLPTIEMAAGTSAEQAGVHLLVLQIVGVVSGLLIPRLLRRPQGQIAAAVTASAPILIGVLGLLMAPGRGIVWVFFLGAGTGASLVVSLTLISMRGRSQLETVKLSGMAQSFGYLLAAVGPILFGTLGQVTGSWTVPLAVVAAVAVAQLLVAVPAGRLPRTAR